MFPNYSKDDPSKSTWTGIVHFYVGRHQRLTGEVKKLTNPIAVIRRKPVEQCMEDGRESREELEIVEIVYHKILFSSRPEPVGDNSILSV